MAFSKAHANELWQADTLVGPYVQHGGTPVQSRLIAFIDDASRVCCHGQFFPSENVDTLIEALRAAFYKRGLPGAIYVDNGSIYTSKEIHQITARLGILLHHAPVRDGAAKGKVERFFRTVRDQFLCRMLDLSGFDILNRQFTHWVEECYNAGTHSTLKMSPLDRFGLDRHLLRFLPPNEVNDELFFVEETRHVRADNTLSFKSVRWETPRHLPNREVAIRFSRRDPKSRVVTEAFRLHRAGRMLVPIIDDAHLMPGECLRKLRLLCEDFPRSHNLILIGQPPLLQTLQLAVNEEVRSRVTYSATLPRLSPEAIGTFLLGEFDRCGLGHNVFTPEALALVARSGEGLLRRTRNLALACLIEAVRDQTRTVDLPQVNRVLMQPHWRQHHDTPMP